MDNKKILLVDDEEIVRLSFKRELQRFYDISTASCYDEALAALAGERFDLLITDLVMPGLDGMELLKKIKTTYPEMSVIVITGYGETKAVVETMRAGADDLLLKPFDIDKLLQRIGTTFARQEELTRSLLSEKILLATTDLVAMVDKNGRYLEANQAYLRAFGTSREALIGVPLAELLGSVQFDTKVAPWLNRCLAGAAVQHVELFRLNDHGLRRMLVSYCPVVGKDTTAVTAAVISMTDATDALQDGDSLRQNEERLRLVHSVSPSGFMDCDLGAGKTYYCHNWQKLLGHGPSALREDGWSWLELLHPDDKDSALQTLQNCIEGRMERYEQQLRLRHNVGHWVWMQTTGRVVDRDGSGTAHRFIGLVSDITEQKRMELEIVRQNELLQRTAAQQTAELTMHNKELQQSRAALNIVLKKRQQDKETLEEQMSKNVLQLIEPLLKRLQRTRLDDDQFGLVREIEEKLHDITSPFITKLTGQAIGLTPMEIQVATHVKQGKATKEIAEILCLAPDTINVHRKKIRKKLGLSNKSINLQSFLTSLSDE